jgi:Ribosomal protein L10
MSKYVKQLITDDIAKKLEDVNDAFVVSLVGMDMNTNNVLRTALAEKKINLMVIKNSLAKRALANTPLAAMFDGIKGSCAVCWGASDVVGLAKEIVRLMKEKQFAKTFQLCGGAMDGEYLTAEQAAEVSKWPSREEQISILVGQLVGVGATLSGQLIGPGAMLASQIKQIAEKDGETAVEEAAV